MIIDTRLARKHLIARLVTFSVVCLIFTLVRKNDWDFAPAWFYHVFAFMMSHYFLHAYHKKESLTLTLALMIVSISILATSWLYFFVPIFFCLHNAFSETDFYSSGLKTRSDRFFFYLHLTFLVTCQINFFDFNVYAYEGYGTFLFVDRSIWSVLNFAVAVLYFFYVLVFLAPKLKLNVLYFLVFEGVLLLSASTIIKNYVPQLWSIYYHGVFWVIWPAVRGFRFSQFRQSVDLKGLRNFGISYGLFSLVAVMILNPSFFKPLGFASSFEVMSVVFRFDFFGAMHMCFVLISNNVFRKSFSYA